MTHLATDSVRCSFKIHSQGVLIPVEVSFSPKPLSAICCFTTEYRLQLPISANGREGLGLKYTIILFKRQLTIDRIIIVNNENFQYCNPWITVLIMAQMDYNNEINSQAVLVLSGLNGDDFLVLGLRNGRVVYSYNLGSGTATIISKPLNLTLTVHVIHLGRSLRKGWLKVRDSY